MRSWPHAGIHCTSLSIASSAASRSVRGCAVLAVIDGSPSMRMNHCDVARKITGLWQRQQCGYWCENVSRCHSRPRSFSASLDLRVRVEHPLPAEQLDVVEEVAARADRRVDLEAVLHARSGSRRRRGRARCAPRRCPARASRSRRARRASRARRADAGSGCPRAPRPSCARPARRTARPTALPTRSAPAPSATMTARPSTS